MNWLIIETSSSASCLVLAADDQIVSHIPLSGGAQLSRLLALEVDLLLKQHPLHIDAIASSTGPGSYTGLRVGASLAQSLAFGWGIPVSGYCSLDAYLGEAALDARGGGLYLSSRKVPPEEVPFLPEPLLSPDAEILKQRWPARHWIQAAPDPQRLLEAAKKSRHLPLQFRYL